MEVMRFEITKEYNFAKEMENRSAPAAPIAPEWIGSELQSIDRVQFASNNQRMCRCGRFHPLPARRHPHAVCAASSESGGPMG